MTPQRHGTCGPGRCGSWSYGYDAAGNLTSQRDGRNQWLYFEYDALNRLVAKRQDSANGTLLAEYQFDATGQKGLLSRSKAYTAEGVVEINNVTYDVRGRLTQQNWIVPGTDGGTFRLDHSYNAADQPATLRYPGGTAGQQGELVTYGYNGLGQLNSVSGSGVSYVSSTTYNARGQVTEQRLDTGSNGLTRQYVYDQNTMRLTTLRAGVASPYTNLQNLSYTYDAAGNVASIVDGVNSSQRQCFGYDALDRLTNAFTGNGDCTAYTTGGTGPYNHTYVYDAVGNLTSYAGTSYTYGDSAHKHAVTSAYGNSYGYDGNGNQTTRTIAGITYTFTFDYENRLTEVKQGSTSLATFLYDADGNRVKGTVSGVTTVYVAGIYEYQGGATTKYYEGGGLRRTGYSTNNGVFYMLSDHLKSTSALVARNGVLNVKYFYYPYGARRGVPFNTITAKHFTGQYHETSLPGGEGLSFYNARWYDPRLGRFLSADTIVPNPSNPQDLNRLAYVRNNPLRYVDPSGHYIFEEDPGTPYHPPKTPSSGPAKPNNNPTSRSASSGSSTSTQYQVWKSGLSAISDIGLAHGRKDVATYEMLIRQAPESLQLIVAASIAHQASDPKDRPFGTDLLEKLFYRKLRPDGSVGIAQLKPSELDRFGLGGRDPLDPNVAVLGMTAKLLEADAYISTKSETVSNTDRLMLLALVQNTASHQQMMTVIDTFYSSAIQSWDTMLGTEYAKDHWVEQSRLILLHIEYLVENGWTLPMGTDLDFWRSKAF